MRCATVRELLTEYLESRLEERLQQDVARHLVDCSRCAQELETLQIAVRALHELTPEPAPPGFAEGVSRQLQSPAPPWAPRYRGLSWKPAAWVAPALAASAVVAMAIWLLPQQFSPSRIQVAQRQRGIPSYTAPAPSASEQASPKASQPQGPALGGILRGESVYPPPSATPTPPAPAVPEAGPQAAMKPSQTVPTPRTPASSLGRTAPAEGLRFGTAGGTGPARDHEASSKSTADTGAPMVMQAPGPQGPAGPTGPAAAPAPRAEYYEIPQHAPTLSETRPSALDSAILPAVTARVIVGPEPKVRLALLRALDERAMGEESVTPRVQSAVTAGAGAGPELEPAEVSDAKWPGLVTVRVTAPPAVAGHYLLALPAPERLGKDTDRVLTRAYERRRIREILADLSSASGLVILAPDPGLALLDLRLRDTTVDQALSLIASSRKEVVYADGAARTLLPARPAGSAR
jgi:hypothetical protein